MTNLTTVHLLGATGRVGVSLSRALRPAIAARQWASVPPEQEVRPGDLLVVDLTGRTCLVDPRLVRPLLRRARLYLLPGDAPINPHWLDIASEPGVRVLATDLGSTRDVIPRLLRVIQGPSGRHIADLVLRAEPALEAVQTLVQAVCLDPWSIRRPRDLALRSRMALGAVRRKCSEVGFHRIEHFIICVRLLAYAELVATEHLPVRTARALVGFDDPSNMRRHARRAASRSPIVERALLHSDQRRHHMPWEHSAIA